MKEEKLNNSIQQKLDGFSSVPEAYNFNQQKLWEQLEGNLLPAKQKRKTIWLAWAAVFLLMMAAYTLFTPNTKPKLQASSIAQKNEMPQAKSVSFSGSDNEKTTNIGSKKSTPIPTNNLVAPNKVLAKTKEPIASPITDTTNNVAEIILAKPTAVIALQTNNTQPPTIAIVPNVAVKKPRLKVVHINELYQTEQQPVLLTKAEQKKLLAEQEENDAPPTEPTKAWWLSKQKTTNTTLIDHQ
jgi:hypothetical protein